MFILIAEDNAEVGRMLLSILPRFISDAKVVVISDALEIATTMQAIAGGDKSTWPDVVISDYHLVNGTGDFVLQLAAQLFPDARLILMSGGADPKRVQDTQTKVSPRKLIFLQKPFATAHLVEAIKG
ncbi:MAG: response regulator [bacterium]